MSSQLSCSFSVALLVGTASLVGTVFMLCGSVCLLKCQVDRVDDCSRVWGCGGLLPVWVGHLASPNPSVLVLENRDQPLTGGLGATAGNA